MSHEAFFSLTLCVKRGNSVLPPAPNAPHIIETIHHCHLGATGTVAPYTGAYNFLRLVLARPLTFHSPGFQRIVSSALLPSRPLRVFISSCRISAASIISHCKAIRVLITRGPPSRVIHQLASATVHMQMQTRVRVLCHACQRHVCAAHNEPIQWGDA